MNGEFRCRIHIHIVYIQAICEMNADCTEVRKLNTHIIVSSMYSCTIHKCRCTWYSRVMYVFFTLSGCIRIVFTRIHTQKGFIQISCVQKKCHFRHLQNGRVDWREPERQKCLPKATFLTFLRHHHFNHIETKELIGKKDRDFGYLGLSKRLTSGPRGARIAIQ